ncbi:MAG: FAD-dependent oxidoreductase [Bacilli bacterium]|nr:FAD-dependent oxidoreductase [Bacilli bacterium]
MLCFDCVIIGSGVAGMTAALYLKRANVNFTLIEKHAPGGQINMTSKIENYPGIETIAGVDLALNMFNQISNLGVDYHYGNVLEIKIDGNKKIIKTDMEEIETKTIIIATGRKARELGLENERQLVGRGISWCATCDGSLYKDKDVAVVGGGNSALEEALYLSNICNKVYIIHRRNELRGDQILQDKIKVTNNIELLYNSVVDTLNEKDGKLDSIIINGNAIKKLNISGVFINIGHEPNIEFVKNVGIDLDEKNNIIVDKEMKTNIDGIYACGDIISKDLYQVVTATSEGAKAAFSVQREIFNK